MIRFEGKEARDSFLEAFGGEPTRAQLRWLHLYSRHSSGRCRNTVAFINYMNGIFGEWASFRVEMEEGERGPYKSVKVEMKNPTDRD